MNSICLMESHLLGKLTAHIMCVAQTVQDEIDIKDAQLTLFELKYLTWQTIKTRGQEYLVYSFF